MKCWRIVALRRARFARYRYAPSHVKKKPGTLATKNGIKATIWNTESIQASTKIKNLPKRSAKTTKHKQVITKYPIGMQVRFTKMKYKPTVNLKREKKWEILRSRRKRLIRIKTIETNLQRMKRRKSENIEREPPQKKKKLSKFRKQTKRLKRRLVRGRREIHSKNCLWNWNMCYRKLQNAIVLKISSTALYWEKHIIARCLLFIQTGWRVTIHLQLNALLRLKHS